MQEFYLPIFPIRSKSSANQLFIKSNGREAGRRTGGRLGVNFDVSISWKSHAKNVLMCAQSHVGVFDWTCMSNRSGDFQIMMLIRRSNSRSNGTDVGREQHSELIDREY